VADSIAEQLAQLERRVELLLAQNSRLRDENQILRNAQEQLVAERAQLLEKTELARARIESMISRLKAMEHH
jgi:TIGR02449 family protein